MKLDIDKHIVKLIAKLQEAGYETYVVGGAVRDLLLDFTPKDYDIATSATPEEICSCLGKRQAIIIGKRFKLVHYRYGQEIIEISTFRKPPQQEEQIAKKNRYSPEKMIFNDNNFGSSYEDAFRRDFTINSLFYDPIKEKIIDYTKQGLKDIENKIVRTIGNPLIRFEEDPVRMLRALKLVGQFDFSLEAKTENALFNLIDYLQYVSISRLTLELEKVFESAYGDKYLETFHDYGLLKIFLPYFEEHWYDAEIEEGLSLFYQRNVRVASGAYRNSISVAIASLLYPTVRNVVAEGVKCREACEMVLFNALKPQCMVKKILHSSEKIIRMQYELAKNRNYSGKENIYRHSCELEKIIKKHKSAMGKSVEN